MLLNIQGFVNDRLTGGSELTFRIFLILAIKIVSIV